MRVVAHRETIRWPKRQREVLDLLVQGKTNAEIGEALGISLDGAKWHVREIMTRLNVKSREDAAEYWRDYHRVPARVSRMAAGLAGVLSQRGWLAAGAGAGLMALVAVLVLVVMAGDSNGGDTPASGITGTVDPGPGSSTPVVSVPGPLPCPVDPEICDFAREKVAVLKSGDMVAFLTPSPWQRSGDLQTASNSLASQLLSGRFSPQAVSVGCPVVGSPPLPSCDEAFAIAIYAGGAAPTAIQPGLVEFLYRRAESGEHELRVFQEPGEDRDLILQGLGTSGPRDFQAYDVIPGPVPIAWYRMLAPTWAVTPTPAPVTVEGVEAPVMVRGADRVLPDDLVLYTNRVRTADGSFTGFVERFRKNRGAELDAEFMFRGIPDWERLHSWVAGEDASQMVANVCADSCPAPGEPSRVRSYRSRDGGVTWSEPTDVWPDGEYVAALVGDIQVLLSALDGKYHTPAGDEVFPPADGAITQFLQGHGYAWVADGTVYHAGLPILESRPNRPDTRVVARLESGEFIITWSEPRVDSWSYIARVDASGAISAAWVVDGEGFQASAVVGANLLIGNLALSPGSVPSVVLFDLRSASIHHIPAMDIWERYSPPGQENVQAIRVDTEHYRVVQRVQFGAHYEVGAGDDCLNVRAEPNAGAEVVICVATGVVLMAGDGPFIAEGGIGGPNWLPVVEPGGLSGWAAEEFLVR